NHAAYKMAVKLLGGQVKPNRFKNGKVAEGETYVEEMMSVIDYNDTWYAVVAESHVNSVISELAEAIHPMRKMFFTSTSTQLAYTQTQSAVYTAKVQYDTTGAATGDTLDVVIAGERYRSTYDASDWGDFEATGLSTFAGDFDINPATGVLTVTNN